MIEAYKKQLKEGGINWEVALDRFMGNETLLMKFLIKFPEDISFQKIKDSLEAEDAEEAFRSAHTLKGVAGNLSLDTLYELLIPFVNLLRTNNIQEAKKLWKKIEETYLLTIEVIRADKV